MTGIFITSTQRENLDEVLSMMDRQTYLWTMAAARGETSWVCADCCCTFPDGMPDECTHGIQRCTDIIQRDKNDAKKETL